MFIMASKKKNNNLTISVASDTIRGIEVMKSGNYKYARLSAKVSEDEYVSISYEWKGENYIPEFVMTLMQYIKANKDEINKNRKEFNDIFKRAFENKTEE